MLEEAGRFAAMPDAAASWKACFTGRDEASNGKHPFQEARP
jgi:hypothetical protein